MLFEIPVRRLLGPVVQLVNLGQGKHRLSPIFAPLHLLALDDDCSHVPFHVSASVLVKHAAPPKEKRTD
jgi:hypothetical protein